MCIGHNSQNTEHMRQITYISNSRRIIKESAIKTNTQGELHVRIKVDPCPFFNGAYAPIKLTIKSNKSKKIIRSDLSKFQKQSQEKLICLTICVVKTYTQFFVFFALF